MTDRIVLRTAFFNLVGGRRQDSSETFKLTANLRTHSGERLGFYAVTEASPVGPMGARARRMVLDVLQGELASRFDLPHGARLKHAVSAAHDALLTEFGGHVQVGLTVLLSQDSALFLLQVPPGQAYVLHEGTLHSVSPTQPGESIGFTQSLGSQAGPYVCLFRDTIESGDVLVLSGSWLADNMDPDDLRSAFAEEEPRPIARTLFDISRHLGASDLTCLALRAEVEPETQSEIRQPAGPAAPPRSVWEYVDDAVGSFGYVLGRAREEFVPPARARPPAGSSMPAVTGASSGAVAVSAPTVLEPPSRDFDLDEEPVLEDIPPAPSALEFDWSREHPTDELPVVAPHVDVSPHRTAPIPFRDRRVASESDLEEVNFFIRQSEAVGRAVPPPVQAFPDTSIAPERIYAGSGVAGENYGTVGGGRPAATATRARPRRAGRQSRTAVVPPAMILWSGVGVGLVLLMILLYAVSTGGGPVYLDTARGDADQAAKAFTVNPKSRLSARDLRAAWAQIALARTHNMPAADIAVAASYVQSRSDTIYNVFRPKATFLARFAALRSHPTQIATGTSDLFILDVKRRQIRGFDLSTGHLLPRAVGEFGDTNYNTGNRQFTFAAPRLLTSIENNAVALDGNDNVLVNDPAPDSPVLTVEPLQPPAATPHLVGAASWNGNLYVLDDHDRQVFRYSASGDSYAPFVSSSQPRLVKAYPALRDGSSIGVANGAIFVALRDGSLLKFAQDKSDPDFDSRAHFAARIPIPFHRASEIYARDKLPYLFLVNSAAGKIVELSQRGAYVRALIVRPNLIRRMHGITISADGSTIYFISGRSLYSMPVIPTR